jgi:hypothetical protein
MSEFAAFLPEELTEIGLMAFADPNLADRLVTALRCLPPAGTVESRTAPISDASQGGSLELAVLAR